MQIIRRSALRRLLHLVHHMPVLEPVDVIFSKVDQEQFRTRAWAAGIVKQFGKRGTSDEERRLSGCKQGVASSLHKHSTIASGRAAEKYEEADTSYVDEHASQIL